MARTRFDASSRYQLDGNGMTATRIPQLAARYRMHSVVSGDTVDNLAHRLLGDHSRWWEIADLNPQLMRDGFLSLVPGDAIRVPS